MGRARSSLGIVMPLRAAINFVPGSTNAQADAFVRDRQAGISEWISLGPGIIRGNG